MLLKLRKSYLWGLLFFFVPSFLTLASTVPLSGQFRVSESGAATYTLPIDAPIGRGGLKPSVSLSYSSSSSDGYLGVGWGLQANSAITRCPSSFEQDGLQRGVKLDDKDKFCLDGQRLVLVSGTHGAAYSQYRKEIDDFSVVTVLGQLNGGGPAAFKVENKAGEVHYYGDVYRQTGKIFKDNEGRNNIDDALVTINNSLTDNKNVGYLWLLKAIEDNVGNYISFHYIKTKSEHYLSNIDYAGHSSGEAPYQSIKFNYINNHKPKSGYISGSAFKISKLLSSIDILIDEALFRHYSLTYNTSGVIEERNYLDRIIACVDKAKNNCSTPISFSWTRPANKPEEKYIEVIDPDTEESRWIRNSLAYYTPFNVARNMNIPAGEYHTAQIFDADGDGLADMIYARQGRWYKRALSTGAEIPMATLGANKHQYAQSIDFDGDGQRDLLVAGNKNSSWYVLSFKPSTIAVKHCEPNGLGGPLCVDGTREVNYTLTNLNVTAIGLEDSAMVADVNGDSLEDIVFLDGDAIKWYKNLGGNFASAATLYTFPTNEGSPQFEPLVTQRTANFKTSAAIDINGDGLTDLLLKVRETTTQCINGRGEIIPFVRTRQECENDHNGTWQQSTTNDWRLLVSTGSGYIEQQRLYGTTNVDTLRVADINGDGLTDIFYVSGNKWWQRLSNGVQFTGSTDTGITTNSTDKHNTYFVDLNGDGRSDILSPLSRYNFNIYMSVPTAGASSAYWQSRGAMKVNTDRTVRFGDIWGRGRVDMLSHDGRNWYSHGNARHKYDSTINAITEGFGVTTRIDYAHLTDNQSGVYDVYKTQNSSNIDPDKNFSLIAPLTVVNRISTEVSDSSSVSVRYEYGGLLVNRLGRGFQGFELLRTIDEQSGIKTETLYEQRFPMTGMPKATRQTYQGQLLSESKNQYTFQTVTTNETAKLHRQSVVNVKDISRQYNSDDTLSDLAQIETINRYDDWGNLSSSSISITDLNTYQLIARTETTNQYQGNGGGAEKGRLSATTVTKSRFEQRINVDSQTRKSQFTYYDNGLLHTSILSPDDAKYKQTTINTYDRYGNKTSTSITGASTANGTNVQTRTSSTTYDRRGRFVKSTTNTLGDVSTNRYNGSSADSVRGPITTAMLTDANGRRITKYYDLWGRSTREVNPDGTNKQFSYQLCTQSNDCSLFADGHLIYSAIKAGAPTSKKVSDRFGREVGTLVQGFTGQWIVTATTYDTQGRVDKQYEPHYDTIGRYFSQATYDKVNRVTHQKLPNGTTSSRYYSGFETQHVDANGKQTTTELNALGEQVKVVDELYNELSFVYDAYGNLLHSYVKSRGNKEVLRTQVSYDNYGRKIQSIDLDKGKLTYTYNAFGELLTQTNASNQVTQLYYDKAGRKVRRTDAEGTSCWLYGTKGAKTAGMLVAERLYDRVENNCNANGYRHQKTFNYDGYGRLSSTSTHIDNSAYVIGFTYDNLGRLKTQKYPNNLLTVENNYNNFGYLYQRKNRTTGLVYQTIKGMDARGKVTQVHYGNGTQENILYQSDTGWVNSIELKKSSTLHHLSYRFDNVGNLNWRRQQLSTAPAVFAESYNYDDLYRLYDRTITVQSGGSSLPVDFKQILKTRYDDWGNIVEKTNTGKYIYDDTNPYRLLDICSGSNCNQKESQAATATCAEGYQFNSAQARCEKTLQQAATPVQYFTCPSGYELLGDTCSKVDFKAAKAIYSCPQGWTLNGDVCRKTLTQNASGQQTSFCPTGYSRSGNRCIKSEGRKATSTYSCANGWTLSGTNCLRTLSQSATGRDNYSCPAGYSLVGAGANRRCQKTTTLVAKKHYYCGSDYQLDGTTCRKVKSASTKTLYICPSGYTRSGTRCSKTETKAAVAKMVPASCPTGYAWNASRGKCRKLVTIIAPKRPNMQCMGGEPAGRGQRMWECWEEKARGTNTQYTCSAGWTVSGTQCRRTLSQTAASQAYKFCPGVYYAGEPENWRLSGSTCLGMDRHLLGPVLSKYTCQAGYSLSGSNCKKVIRTGATRTKVYSCPTGYSRTGTTCRKNESKNANRIYSCPAGWSRDGDSCKRTLTQLASTKMIYSCASGWSLSGSKCLKTVAQTPKRTYLCDSGWRPTGDQCYKLTTQSAQSNTRLNCPTNWHLTGTTCYMLVTRPPTYSCPVDWTREGAQCTRLKSPAYRMQYDKRGNIIADGNRRFDYTSYDLVNTITQGDEFSRFEYDVNHARFKRQDVKLEAGSKVNYTTYYVSGYYEKVLRSGGGKAALTEQKLYVGNVVITIRSNSTSDTYYLHKDHQGSTTTITNANGTVVQQLTYDPWGKQTAAYTHSLLSHYISPAERKGYTGHEGLNNLSIIHMNGRINDPTLGRFLQADPHIQAPLNSQNYNRYSYVLNNPMSYSDPSGYFFKKLYKALMDIGGITFTHQQIAKVNGLGAGIQVALNFIPYFGQLASAHFAFDASFVATGSLSSAIKSGVISYAAASIGRMASGLSPIELFIVQGTAGGIFNVVQGGEFGHGFIAAGIGILGAQGASAIGLAGNEAGRLITAAVIGGTVSELTGGKFANGAASAAFAAVVSQVGISKSGGNEARANEVDDWATEDEAWLQETMAQTAIDLENGDVYVYEPGWLRLQERSLFDGEFGSGTYTDVMDDAGGIALEGAATLYGGYCVLRGGYRLYRWSGFRYDGYGRWKNNGVWQEGHHFHLGTGGGLDKHHLPQQAGNW